MKRTLQRFFLALPLVLAGAAWSPALAQTPEARPEHTQEEHPASADGEHGEAAAHHGVDPKTLALQFLNFGVLLFILIKFGGKPLKDALRTRHEELKSALEEATRLRAAAEARFKKQEARLANLEQELARMRAGIQREAEHERVRIVDSAVEKARRIQDDTRFQLDQQVKEAQLRFREEVATAAVKIAGELLRRSVTAQDEQRLVTGFVGELGGRPGGAGPDGRPPRPPSPEEVVS